MAKNEIFKVQNVAIYALFGGKFLEFGKCACVKKLTNMMSVSTAPIFIVIIFKNIHHKCCHMDRCIIIISMLKVKIWL